MLRQGHMDDIATQRIDQQFQDISVDVNKRTVAGRCCRCRMSEGHVGVLRGIAGLWQFGNGLAVTVAIG